MGCPVNGGNVLGSVAYRNKYQLHVVELPRNQGPLPDDRMLHAKYEILHTPEIFADSCND